MFITFEGIEGSGKTTQAQLLRDFLVNKGYRVTFTREPGWGILGRLIRRMLLEERNLELDPVAELCLFCADRAQHVKELLKPRLKAGDIVICDRFADSTVVYQGYGRGLDIELVKKVANASTLGLKPDITLLLNLPVKIALSRIRNRESMTKFEEEPLEFHERIRQGYLFIAQKEPDRIKVINAARGVDQIREEITDIVLTRLSR
ncbi:MAG: thymidylate kinase [Deltaproteobacteria bacterium]|nr:MAG: thymidylate kinase [Deltaproteobacteria bacterium]